MSRLSRSKLPNVITIGRILLTPAIALLVFVPDGGARLLAFVLFLVAGVSDLWDGYLARKHGWTTDFGTLMDPIADKLLLVATFVPIYLLSHRADPILSLPFWGTLPAWVLIVVFGRELLVTAIRAVAARRGVVIAAGQAGKYKAFAQNFFSGTTLLWYALRTFAGERGWTGPVWEGWQAFHGVVLALALLTAVVLSLYSLVVYLRAWRPRAREGG